MKYYIAELKENGEQKYARQESMLADEFNTDNYTILELLNYCEEFKKEDENAYNEFDTNYEIYEWDTQQPAEIDIE